MIEITEITVPTGFTKDTWVTSIEIRPGNRSVVHPHLSLGRFGNGIGWQLGYDAKKPIVIRKGTGLEATARFDNSANNRFNPDPSKDVWWGDQTWEEMMIPYFGVVVGNNVNPEKTVAYSTASDAVK